MSDVQHFLPESVSSKAASSKPAAQPKASSKSTSTSPLIGFVSLGCPKNLVDSERILTQLRTEGYEIVPSYDNADMVIVNTCGFIDSAVQESLDAIGEALKENGKVLVTGCLGARDDEIREVHPNVLAITGPHAYEEVMSQVHEHLPKPELIPKTKLVFYINTIGAGVL